MLLISLMLAAAPAPAVKPDAVRRREAPGRRLDRAAARSKRLVELEAAVRALPRPEPEPAAAPGPEGL